jgi:VIT1/CCC1 family predicted Fe2+/Mn2+ transporter
MTSDTPTPETIGFGGLGARLNWLRAGVLGANDGLVSGSGICIGVAAANPTNTPAILTAGFAGLLAGACAMAMGEYVSVSSQRDSEKALIAKERHDLTHTPTEEFDELVSVYEGQGLTESTARLVVKELTAHDPLAAHLRAEYGIHQDELTNPWHAAAASAVAFTTGFVLPLLAMMLIPATFRIPVTVAICIVGLYATGWLSAFISNSTKWQPIIRNVLGGSAAMALTWVIGHLFGVVAG